MKKIFTICILLFSIISSSCTKEKLSADQRGNCLQTPPAFCATVRCTPDGKPVCGCNKVTYGSACEAQCAGVTSYTGGPCP